MRGSAVKGAQKRLKSFRQASILAVAITGFIMLLFAPSEAGLAQDDPVAVDSVALAEEDLAATAATDTTEVLSSKDATYEAIGALQGLWESFLYNLPKMLIALGTLVLAWVLIRLINYILKRVLGRWQSSSAIISLVSIAGWLLAAGVAISVVAGDIRALVGSLGLIGLALSWSLQTPIESFTGWLMNSFKGYYRVGDRIRVGEVFGDVYRIDFLNTTVWEIGAPYQSGFVQAEQPTGRLVTFPNNEILTGSVINLTGDFPYVWDELSVGVANESDMKLAMKVLEIIAEKLLGSYMVEPTRAYASLLKSAGLDDNVPDQPQVFISMDDSWTNITIRYLVGARERRKWKSELTLRITEELNKPEYRNKIIPVYPRQQVQFIDPNGVPVEARFMDKGSSEKAQASL
ncbi:mechanosensitive ion channel family protein [Pontibacter beigongshangensis]|uniref:mechanosensitive ion channel family protein n=1 Tax=Pontibacter beigongshangensis TaxID=2574733 RepID=UPI001F504476|nr:mechanosensitive ion channel domain-containing protein [Pontibacter beigongshangensis]